MVEMLANAKMSNNLLILMKSFLETRHENGRQFSKAETEGQGEFVVAALCERLTRQVL
jgi:hypothetical protein